MNISEKELLAAGPNAGLEVNEYDLLALEAVAKEKPEGIKRTKRRRNRDLVRFAKPSAQEMVQTSTTPYAGPKHSALDEVLSDLWNEAHELRADDGDAEETATGTPDEESGDVEQKKRQAEFERAVEFGGPVVERPEGPGVDSRRGRAAEH